MNYENIAQPWQTTAQQHITLPVRANNRFFYKHHPKNWELYYFEIDTGKKIINKPVWLPDLHVHHETPGVNGTRGFTGNPDSGLTRTRLVDKGWVVINANQHDYLRKYPARKGAYWADKFTRLENIGGELVKTFEHDNFAKWKLELMQNGVISLPHKTFLQRKMMDTQRRIQRHTRNQHIPEIAAKLQGLQDLHDDMKKAAADLEKNGVKHYEL
tara:strand:- start:1889 stop:2530 length:642 start_codon:yes stop_codon:yes gene_type:complete